MKNGNTECEEEKERKKNEEEEEFWQRAGWIKESAGFST